MNFSKEFFYYHYFFVWNVAVVILGRKTPPQNLKIKDNITMQIYIKKVFFLGCVLFFIF